MAIAILQGLQHKAMANRHECNECVIMKMPHKGCIQHSRVWRHYFAFTKVYICAKVAYYISPRCVHCKKVHKKQQTITSFSQKLHKSSDTKKRRRPPTLSKLPSRWIPLNPSQRPWHYCRSTQRLPPTRRKGEDLFRTILTRGQFVSKRAREHGSYTCFLYQYQPNKTAVV